MTAASASTEFLNRRFRGKPPTIQPPGWEGLPVGYRKVDGLTDLMDARDPALPRWLRLAHAAMSRMDFHGVALFKRGELQEILGPVIDPATGEVLASAVDVTRALDEAKTYGRIAKESTRTRIVVPPRVSTYSAPTPWEESRRATNDEGGFRRFGSWLQVMHDMNPDVVPISVAARMAA